MTSELAVVHNLVDNVVWEHRQALPAHQCMDDNVSSVVSQTPYGGGSGSS